MPPRAVCPTSVAGPLRGRTLPRALVLHTLDQAILLTYLIEKIREAKLCLISLSSTLITTSCRQGPHTVLALLVRWSFSFSQSQCAVPGLQVEQGVETLCRGRGPGPEPLSHGFSFSCGGNTSDFATTVSSPCLGWRQWPSTSRWPVPAWALLACTTDSFGSVVGGTFSPPQEGHRSPWCRLRGSEAPESISPNHTLIFLQSGGGLSVDHEDEVLLLRFG